MCICLVVEDRNGAKGGGGGGGGWSLLPENEVVLPEYYLLTFLPENGC